MINYGSTDRSVEIIKELCPTWRIIDTRNKFFGALEIDQEIHDIEKTIDGWRIVLNTTEFLLGNFSKLDTLIDVKIPMVCLVDTKDNDGKLPDTTVPLTRQRSHGVNPFVGDNFNKKRARFFHKTKNVTYPTGRHYDSFDTHDFLIIRFDYAPWNAEILKRKMQIGAKQLPSDLTKGWGTHHQFNEKQHIELRDELLKISEDMTTLIRSFEYWEHK